MAVSELQKSKGRATRSFTIAIATPELFGGSRPQNSDSGARSRRKIRGRGAQGIGTTKVVMENAGTVATKLHPWIATAGSETRFSVREVRSA